MRICDPRRLAMAGVMLGLLFSVVNGQEIQLLQTKPDPYGCPRPAPGQTNVPTSTSFYFQVGFKENQANDEVLAESVAVQIRPQGGSAVDMLTAPRNFAEGYSGKFAKGRKQGGAVVVNIEGEADLLPATTYIVSVSAKSRDGVVLSGEKGQWKFTTEDATASYATDFALDLSTRPVRWQGGFFTGFCKPSFCTSAASRISAYELIQSVQKQYPKVLTLIRDVSPTGMGHTPRFPAWNWPNVVRERETRRIIAMEQRDDGILLRVEDFFGHEQYSIASNRPLSGDYHPDDEVLIADVANSARAKVVAVVEDSSGSRSLLVTSFKAPTDGWKIEYDQPLPVKSNPDAPGLFPPGGCHLRKFRPVGTPHYFWERLDKEWDISHRRFGRRLVVNFTDAPGDLSVDGRNWTYPKDYFQYHQVVRAYTDHLIERYGDACLDFVWSVFNEADLAAAFWRSGDWNELQKFYDYTVDAVLRSFEDHGYDSNQVFIGGLEIGGIFGVHIAGPILQKFLVHCSPTASADGALEHNAAFMDKRLDGQRSRRVENLCRGTEGKGSPCDFISVHTYNASPVAAAKLIRGKQLALEIDAEYYAKLWVNSFESCPGWSPPPDVAASDSYLGNGYFPTWCADVIRRQLAQAAQDGRYAFGETILTFWPWPNHNFSSINNATRVIDVDEDGDGKKDRTETVAMPILNFLALISAMGDDYHALGEQQFAGHLVSGFVSNKSDAVNVLLYSHNPHDIQSRSKKTFEIALDLNDIPWPEVQVKQYRFDKDNNSYYHLGRELRDNPTGKKDARRLRPEEVDQLVADLTGADPNAQIAAVKKAVTYDDLP